MTLTIDDGGVGTRVVSYLERHGLAARGARVIPLAGDASDRRYLRVLLPDAPSVVLAVHTQAFVYATLPFVNVAELFERMSLPVPRILGHDDDLGILALEDLGDVTLQARLEEASQAEAVALYRQAIDVIATMQRRGHDLASARYVPYGLAFDVEKLMWEMEFFITHFLEAYLGTSIRGAERAAIRGELGRLVEALAAEPRVLCHRDFHSRNLMTHADRVWVIDFQDARMGPDTYDVVSLLRDSYVEVNQPLVNDLVGYFLEQKGASGSDVEFRRRFDLMAVQRHLKALGTFGYQATTKRNPAYVAYVPRTVRDVRATLERVAPCAALREMLAPHWDRVT